MFVVFTGVVLGVFEVKGGVGSSGISLSFRSLLGRVFFFGF